MVKVIAGLKGSGKTKRLIEDVQRAAKEESGDVVCIEKGDALTYDIPYSVRLVKASQYKFGTIEYIKGFICGLHAGNFDITHIFIDGLIKLIGDASYAEIESLLDWCDSFGEKEGVKFTVTLSLDVELATPGIKKYL